MHSRSQCQCRIPTLDESYRQMEVNFINLIECCNEVEVMMKEINNNVDAPEGACGDNKRRTIVDIIFEDFSTTPFNSPTASPERKLINLERSPLFILQEKPKRNYSREFKEKTNSNLEEKFKAAIDDNENMSTLLHDKHFLNSKKSYDSTPETERKASDRCYTRTT
ncbi:uncharacterized protein ACN2A1_001751 [Glossina fuscipes fuscipes]